MVAVKGYWGGIKIEPIELIPHRNPANVIILFVDEPKSVNAPASTREK